MHYGIRSVQDNNYNLQRAKLRKETVNIGKQIAYALCTAQCTVVHRKKVITLVTFNV